MIKSLITRSNSRSRICPCPTITRASGTSAVSFLLYFQCLRHHCGDNKPVRHARFHAKSLRTTRSSFWRTKVLILNRRAGGVEIMDRSRIPFIAILRVLGIGVAVRVRISIFARSCLIFSFALHQNGVLHQ